MQIVSFVHFSKLMQSIIKTFHFIHGQEGKCKGFMPIVLGLILFQIHAPQAILSTWDSVGQVGSPKRVGDDDQTAAMAVTEGTLEVRRSINGPVASGRW